MGNFNPVDRDEFKKHNQNGGTHNCIISTVIALWTPCNFTYRANSLTSKVEIYTRPKLCHLGRYVVRAKLFCLKRFVPVTGLESSYEIFSSRLPRSRSQKPRSRKPGKPGLSYEHIDIFTKKIVAKPSQPGRPGSYEEVLTQEEFQCVHVQNNILTKE